MEIAAGIRLSSGAKSGSGGGDFIVGAAWVAATSPGDFPVRGEAGVPGCCFFRGDLTGSRGDNQRKMSKCHFLVQSVAIVGGTTALILG